MWFLYRHDPWPSFKELSPRNPFSFILFYCPITIREVRDIHLPPKVGQTEWHVPREEATFSRWATLGDSYILNSTVSGRSTWKVCWNFRKFLSKAGLLAKKLFHYIRDSQDVRLWGKTFHWHLCPKRTTDKAMLAKSLLRYFFSCYFWVHIKRIFRSWVNYMKCRNVVDF